MLEVMPRARRDIARLSHHIAKTNPLAAAMLVDQITAKMKWIADVDFTGVPRHELGPGIRAFTLP
ncbi:plasmid stabilization system protein ParE [Gellertiella hungarica]|uniref:Plasmid stabilization system protein ParE n=1 Tax=Gellertiella hungarica TaxID=1572859 RepID=A0A7W6J600_9HYPH|nr:plasmid stabilization system protein ParE [Gellertiella hungarica]